MGRGRNKRRRNRKKQLKKNKEPKNKKPNQNKVKAKYRSPKRKKRKKMENPEPIRLGVTAAFLADKGNKEFLTTLKGWLDRGIVSNLVFLAFGKWNQKTQSRLKSIVYDNNFGWAWNHLVFKMPGEFEDSYLLRCMRCYELNHYVDSEPSHLTTIVLSKHYDDTNVFYWNNKVKQIENFKDWLKGHNGQYTILHEMGIDANQVISAGRDIRYLDYDVYGAT